MGIVRSEAYWRRGLGVLDYSNYIALNRTLIKAFGLNAAVLLCELISEARYWNARGELHDGWFFSSIKNVKERCGLSKYQQAEAMKDLKESGVVEVDHKGTPRTRHIRVDAQKVLDIIDDCEEGLPASGTETGPLDGEKPALNKKNNTYKVELGAMGESQVDFSSTYDFQVSGGFVPPTLEEVREYVRGNMLDKCDPDLFFATYDAQGWVLGNGIPMTNWQSAVRKWHVQDRNKAASEPRDVDWSKYDPEHWERG